MYKTKASHLSTDWVDWKYQLKHSIRTLSTLEEWIKVSPQESAAIIETQSKYRWAITPYYASLMDKENENCPIRLQAIPHKDEMRVFQSADIDPVGDRTYLKTRRVVHKYPNRVIFLVSDTCPVYCRHCTRKYHTTDIQGTYFDESKNLSYEEDFAYIESHTEIDDVLLTGGDPLTLTDRSLEKIIARLRQISHINIIRMGSRYPVLLPQRITPELCNMLDRYQPIWFSTHFNHPKEITEESATACDRLLRKGIPVQNQSVLLKGINDNLDTMRNLLKGLLHIRVRPYYLYHCDNVTGVSHFSTSIEKGLEIMEGLAGFETGFSVPNYVIATKIGKIPLQGRQQIWNENGRTYVTNYQKKILNITEYLTQSSSVS